MFRNFDQRRLLGPLVQIVLDSLLHIPVGLDTRDDRLVLHRLLLIARSSRSSLPVVFAHFRMHSLDTNSSINENTLCMKSGTT